jgi:hypothetical protein
MRFVYPGPGQIVAKNVTQRTPNVVIPPLALVEPE